MWRFIGVPLLIAGVIFSIPRTRPWMDYDFLLVFYGTIFVLDYISLKLSKFSIFSSMQNFLLIGFSSVCAWWFFEGENLYLKLYSYPIKKFYEPSEFGVMSTVAFVMIIPLLILSTNIVKSLFFKEKVKWAAGIIKRSKIYFLIGVLFIIINLLSPLYTWPLAGIILLLLFDPFNGKQGKRSIIVQIKKKNFKPLAILGLASIFAGLVWEGLNFIAPKWEYPLIPWFWTLPQPTTTKLAAMPLAGYLGYIPFMWSIFAFIEFLGLGKNWLKD